MSIKSQEFFDCTEDDSGQLFVSEISDKVYFCIMSDFEDAVMLNRESVQKLVTKLNGWLEKGATHEESI